MQNENVTGWWHTCVKEKTLGSFFDAADALYAIQPWRRVPDHGCLIHMMMPSFGKRTWVVSVLGQEDIDSRGIMLFDHAHAYRQFNKISDAQEAGIKPTKIPAHDVLHFEHSHDVPESLRQHVAEKGWWATDKEAFPTVLEVEPNLSVVQVHQRDVVFFESLTRALAKALETPEPWLLAWQGGEPVEMTLTVTSSDGEQEVVLGSELSQGFDLFTGSDSELLNTIDQLPHTNKGIIDFDQLERLERSLLSRVAALPEALEIEDPTLGLEMLLDFANQLHIPVTQLNASELRQMLFDEIPQSAMVGGDSAQTLILSLKLAYQWMMANHALLHGADILNLFDDSAIERLETRLVDKHLFSLRKLQMIKECAGALDTTLPETFNAMMNAAFGGSSVYRSLVLDELEDTPYMTYPKPLPTTPALSAKQKAKRKSNRKAARKARKKNR